MKIAKIKNKAINNKANVGSQAFINLSDKMRATFALQEFECISCGTKVMLTSFTTLNQNKAHFKASTKESHTEQCEVQEKFLRMSSKSRLKTYESGYYKTLIDFDTIKYSPGMEIEPGEIYVIEKKDIVLKNVRNMPDGTMIGDYNIGNPFKEGISFSKKQINMIMNDDEVMYFSVYEVLTRSGVKFDTGFKWEIRSTKANKFGYFFRQKEQQGGA